MADLQNAVVKKMKEMEEMKIIEGKNDGDKAGAIWKSFCQLLESNSCIRNQDNHLQFTLVNPLKRMQTGWL